MSFHKGTPISLMLLSQLGSCDAELALVCLEIIIICNFTKQILVGNNAVWQKNFKAKIPFRRKENIFSPLCPANPPTHQPTGVSIQKEADFQYKSLFLPTI